MSCSIINDLMMKYFDRNINDIESAQLKQHLKTCEKCSTDFSNFNKIFAFLEKDGIVEPPVEFEAQVMSKVSSIEIVKKKQSDRTIIFLYTVAAVVLFILSAMFIKDIRGIGGSMLATGIGEIFGSFSSLLDTVNSMLNTLNILANGISGALLQASIVIFKEYYYIFALLAVMFFLVQNKISTTVRHRNGGAK